MEYRMVPSSGGGFKSFLVLTMFFLIVAFFVSTQTGIRASAKTSSNFPTAAGFCGSYVVVNSGDTLSQIAQRCAVSEADLLAANPHLLNANTLAVGETLRVPSASVYNQQAVTTAFTIPVTGDENLAANAGIGGGSDLTPLNTSVSAALVEQYTIQPGDTLGRIANAHNITLATLLSYNPTVTNPDVIYPGEIIQIPLD